MQPSTVNLNKVHLIRLKSTNVWYACMLMNHLRKTNKQLGGAMCHLFSFYTVVRRDTTKSDHEVEAVCTVVNAHFTRQCSK